MQPILDGPTRAIVQPSLDDLGLWPVRPRPLLDELFTSWLWRLAAAHGLSVHAFCRQVWPGRRVLDGQGDLDRMAPVPLLGRVSGGVDLPASQLYAATLRAYTGWLYEEHDPNGKTRWLLPRGGGPRGRAGSLQFCPECLAADPAPYFRRAWRLSLSTACPRHRRLLGGACPGCRRPFDLLASVPPARQPWPQTDPIFICRRCGGDLRQQTEPATGSDMSPPPALDQSACAFQTVLLSVLARGWVEVPGAGPVYSHLFFHGVHQLLKLLTAGGEAGQRLGAAVRREVGCEGFTPLAGHSRKGTFFDGLPVRERHLLLGMVGWLLDEWPHRFVDLCRRERVPASTLFQDMDHPPFWYWNVVREHLSVLPARWRSPARGTKREQVSYGVLALRRTSRRLAAQERRIEFTRAHPELWDKPVELAKAMHAASLYAPATHHSAIARHCPKLVALAKNPNEWWRDRRAKRAVVPDLHGPVRVR